MKKAVNKTKLLMTIILVFGTVSCSKSSPEIPFDTIVGERCENPKQFTLHAGNQSGHKNKVDIKVWVDGTLIVNEYFLVRNHHYWKPYKFQICDGWHELEAESSIGGARKRFKFEVTHDADYGLLSFWNNPEEKLPSSFTFNTGPGDFHPA